MTRVVISEMAICCYDRFNNTSVFFRINAVNIRFLYLHIIMN